MSRSNWILVGLVVLILVTGTGIVIYQKKQIRDAFWVAFDAAGLNGDWALAMLDVESYGGTMGAVNQTGADAARGGAWGPTQITEKTARAYGFTEPMAVLTQDLEKAVALTVKIVKAGHPKSLEDLGAWWNAGRYHFTDLAASNTARTEYVPALLRAYERIMA